jgi:hypothetical protein
MTKQQFDIGTYFTIKYYADKHSKTITRRAQWDEKCKEQISKKGIPYMIYFDVDADNYRCASKSWKISEVKV